MEDYDIEIEILQRRLGYVFKDLGTLEKVFYEGQGKKKPKARSQESKMLEQLGDRLLSAVLVVELSKKHKRLEDIHTIHEALANNAVLSGVCVKLFEGLPAVQHKWALACDPASKHAANILEAILGAIWIDSENFETLKSVIPNLYGRLVGEVQ